MGFYKYQGAGNDFVMIDDREKTFNPTKEYIEQLCHRRFGIGADGLILLHIQQGVPTMKYFNSDGNEGSMCGNGGRCFVRFCFDLGLYNNTFEFDAVDGRHEAIIQLDNTISLKMQDVKHIEQDEDAFVLDTGSPHYCTFAKDITHVDVKKMGAEIRYSKRFREKGINVNFVEMETNYLKIRTYERGVEDETYACGTGVTAAALSFFYMKKMYGENEIDVWAKGGKLRVRAQFQHNVFTNIWLNGGAEKVFEGVV